MKGLNPIFLFGLAIILAMLGKDVADTSLFGGVLLFVVSLAAIAAGFYYEKILQFLVEKNRQGLLYFVYIPEWDGTQGGIWSPKSALLITEKSISGNPSFAYISKRGDVKVNTQEGYFSVVDIIECDDVIKGTKSKDFRRFYRLLSLDIRGGRGTCTYR